MIEISIRGKKFILRESHMREEFFAYLLDWRKQPFSIFKNPDISEVQEILKKSESPRELRAFVYKRDLYIWDAMISSHHTVIETLIKKGKNIVYSDVLPLFFEMRGDYIAVIGVTSTVTYTKYEMFSDLNTWEVNPKIFSVIKDNPNIKRISLPNVRYKTRIAD